MSSAVQNFKKQILYISMFLVNHKFTRGAGYIKKDLYHVPVVDVRPSNAKIDKDTNDYLEITRQKQ